VFTTLLIANRGEIACRVAATARRLGLKTIDGLLQMLIDKSKHIASCDLAVRIGPATAKESYLNGDVILDVAKRYGAQAIHPGYGVFI